jgi:hypothetical protein
VRTTPLVGTKAWFGPRRFGWGLEPISAEGWAATVAFGAVAIWTAQRKLKGPVAWLLGGAYVALALVKGTAPGGPRSRVALTAERAPG